MDTEQDDARESAAASIQAASVQEMTGSDLVATSAALSRQKEAQLAAKEAMSLRGLSRDREGAALMKAFLKQAPVGTVSREVKERVDKEALCPGEEPPALGPGIRMRPRGSGDIAASIHNRVRFRFLLLQLCVKGRRVGGASEPTT